MELECFVDSMSKSWLVRVNLHLVTRKSRLKIWTETECPEFTDGHSSMSEAHLTEVCWFPALSLEYNSMIGTLAVYSVYSLRVLGSYVCAVKARVITRLVAYIILNLQI